MKKPCIHQLKLEHVQMDLIEKFQELHKLH